MFHLPAAAMPRPRRIVLPSAPLHIIQRGNNRVPCFVTPSDYLAYLNMLQECAFDCACALHAYVLMTNHVHLLLSPDDESGASTMMQRLGRRYVHYFNRRHGRTGTLWEGRFRSSLIQDERYLMVCHRYIELNPVRARMVDTPSAYPWSSHSANAFGQDNALLTPHLSYTKLGTDPTARQAAYRHLFDEALSEEVLDRVRQAGNGNRALGAVCDASSDAKLVLETFPKIGV
ncbi:MULTISPECIES: transposase [unclassified Massilia]|uniref:transposase n=1 Tax=unclassified Massilia TaxID=2609279 RepID=UPI0009EC3926|nr:MULTISPECIES: transposase [unclassified Massilia]